MTNQEANADSDNLQILTDWLEAVTLFQLNYTALLKLLPPLTQLTAKGYVKQSSQNCTKEKLVSLVISMQAQLEMLALQMDQLSTVERTKKRPGWHVLTTHTHTLNRLNRSAQIYLLELTSYTQ